MRVKTVQDVGNLVHDQPKALGMTQAQLAARVGTSRLWINQVESGHGGAALARVLALLSALGLSMNVDVPEHPVAPAPDPTDVPARAAGAVATDSDTGRKMPMPKARPVPGKAADMPPTARPERLEVILEGRIAGHVAQDRHGRLSFT
ncbi:helix-turn-helix domain-containing protein [Actinocatenispora sera]|uniref:HTH cro/C1-type domain-containing protein n=1 Tax=Actinocatenispora sera TaxID=390989 RepID=A0A810L0C2_9ACTN|nr:helix-turn-helix domain-containing protein [Actinocatenispora sera]BCJ28229.1 hypothetical protein Asera_23370 [Actinocatenispora sera]